MSAEQDSVRRLAEAREVITSHPLPLEVRGAVDVLCSMIDSLTAERDNAVWRANVLDAAGRTASLHAQAQAARAEAAEADRERLREALSVVHECAEKRLDDIPPYPKRIDEMNEAEVAIQNVAAHCCGALVFIEQYARAALATPPSEGQS